MIDSASMNAHQLLQRKMDYIFKLAKVQIDTSMDARHINIWELGLDEVNFLPHVDKSLGEQFYVPLCPDSYEREAIVATIQVISGKLLINSVNSEEASMNKRCFDRLSDHYKANQAFLALGAEEEDSFEIVNPEKLTPIILATVLLLGRNSFVDGLSRIFEIAIHKI